MTIGVIISITLFTANIWIDFYLNIDQNLFEGIILGILSPVLIIGLPYLVIDRILDY
jgi:hypothetical protein